MNHAMGGISFRSARCSALDLFIYSWSIIPATYHVNAIPCSNKTWKSNIDVSGNQINRVSFLPPEPKTFMDFVFSVHAKRQSFNINNGSNTLKLSTHKLHNKFCQYSLIVNWNLNNNVAESENRPKVYLKF
jgi:hypothetical protein